MSRRRPEERGSERSLACSVLHIFDSWSAQMVEESENELSLHALLEYRGRRALDEGDLDKELRQRFRPPIATAGVLDCAAHNKNRWAEIAGKRTFRPRAPEQTSSHHHTRHCLGCSKAAESAHGHLAVGNDG